MKSLLIDFRIILFYYSPRNYNYPLSNRNDRSLERPSSMQNIPLKLPYRNAGSVESERRNQINRGYADYYQAHPAGVGINLKGLEKNYNIPQAKKPPLPSKNEKPPHYPPVYPMHKQNPVKARPQYNVMPSWWG